MKDKCYLRVLSILVAVMLIGSVGVCSVYAEGEDEAAQQVVADPGQQEAAPEDTPGDTAFEPEEQQTPQDQDDQAAETEAEQYEPIYEYFYSYPEEATSVYEEPQYLSDLPEVSDSDVVQPTAVVIPDVAVSDASMFSGIVMWLCVALGIAVIVGVLVSKRTRRRGV